MKLRPINFLTAASLLLCAFVAVVWARSYAIGEVLYHARFQDDGRWTFWVRDELHLWRGQIGFARVVSSGNRATYRSHVEKRLAGEKEPLAFRRRVKPAEAAVKLGKDGRSFAGFGLSQRSYVRQDGSVCAATDRVIIPLWPVAVAFMAMPALRGALHCRRHVRRVAGLCARCAYDVRASPGRCPECGALTGAA